MLKKRLITVLTFYNGILYRTRSFVPDYRYTKNFIDTWSVDEIIALDITRNKKEVSDVFLENLKLISKNCFVPICAGGKIKSVKDVDLYLKSGADKISINTEAFLNPELVKNIIDIYGTQVLTLSIDVKKINERYEIFINNGQTKANILLEDYICKMQKIGIGEILINSIDKDGTLEGYDLTLLKLLKKISNVPVISLGGAGNWKHFFEAVSSVDIDAVATNNIYHFTENSIISAKKYLKKNGLNFR
tara:strand:+ start:2616 stop:3356 length:741 start_codon:yes stop_codon:yes gene_type:complete